MPLSRLFSVDLSDGRCHRADCVVCLNHTGRGSSKCKRKSIVYKSICSVCLENGAREGQYIGESGRSLYERSREHLEDADKQKDGSHIWKHWAVSHPELLEQPQFIFKVIKVHNSPLDRQIHEAIRISSDGFLNARCEYRQNQVKRLTVSLTARELKAEEAHANKLDVEIGEAIQRLKKRLKDRPIVSNKVSLNDSGLYFRFCAADSQRPHSVTWSEFRLISYRFRLRKGCC